MTDDQIITRWLESKANSSRDVYANGIERFRAFLGDEKNLAEVELGDVQRYARHLDRTKGEHRKKLAANTKQRLIATIKSFFTFAVTNEYLPKNPALRVRTPKAAETLGERILTREEVDRLIQAETRPKENLLLRVLFYSGARVSEVTNLRWRNIQPNKEAGGQLSICGKGEKSRTVAIGLGLYEELCALQVQQQGKRDDFVFISQKSPQLSRHQVFRIVKKAAKKSGIKWAASPHWLRHTHATEAIDHGAPLHLVQETLGHSDLSTTGKYLHARPGDSSSLYLGPVPITPANKQDGRE